MFNFGHNVNVGYYAQEHDNLQADASLLDNIRAAVPTERHPHRDAAARDARG